MSIRTYYIAVTCDNISWPYEVWERCSDVARRAQEKDFELREHELEPGSWVSNHTQGRTWVVRDNHRLVRVPGYFGYPPDVWWQRSRPLLRAIAVAGKAYSTPQEVSAHIRDGLVRFLQDHPEILAEPRYRLGVLPETYCTYLQNESPRAALERLDRFWLMKNSVTSFEHAYCKTSFDRPYVALRYFYRGSSRGWVCE